MLFNSPIYIFIFLPVVIIIYFFLNKIRLTFAGKIWLVLASLFFYGYWSEKYLILIMSSILINYSLGRALRLRAQEKGKEEHGFLRRKTILVIGIGFNIGLLGYYKYIDFFIENIRWIFQADIPLFRLALPLAISFFTFQQIAFLVDSYKKGTKEYNFINYCLFVTFFPQLISGPIVHHSEVMPQFARKKNHILNWKNISMGLFIFSMGLFKKVFIADTFSLWAAAGFDSDAQLSFFEAWGTSLSFTFQIYYDFSGYTDMAIGAALMCNIRLPENFNSPYQAPNITEFWKRWHMTFMRWIRDYVYVPLRQLNRSEPNAHLSLMIALILSGLWHGAGWLFIIFGALHGIALSIHRVWKQLGYKMSALKGVILTFIFLNLTTVFFRARELEDVGRVLGGMVDVEQMYISKPLSILVNSLTQGYFGLVEVDRNFILPMDCAWYIFIFGVLTFFFKNSTQVARNIHSFKYFHALYIAFVLIFVLLSNIQNTPSEFLYYNF